MAFSREFLEEVKQRNNIEEVVGRVVSLKRAGGNLVGLCPFHSERTPSFTVFPATSSYYCFGCGAGGDAVTFVMQTENLEYVPAVELLAKRAGMRIEEDPAARNAEYKPTVRRERLYELNRAAAKLFYAALLSPQGAKARDYLENTRRFTAQTVKRFGLGYASGGGALCRELMKQGFTELELHTAFLGRRYEESGRMYDIFRDRLMFPVLDTNGEVVAFSGRRLNESEERKYVNTSDTPVFKKSKVLFGLNIAKNSETGTLILCEGAPDAIAMHQAGFDNAVATLGTAITPDHARTIARYCRTVYLAYDIDKAGRKATMKAIELLNQVGVDTKIINLGTETKDPDEFIKKFGADAFRAKLTGSSGQIDYRIDEIISRYDTDIAEEKLRAVNELTSFIATLASRPEREVYSARAAGKLGLTAESLRSEVERVAAKTQKKLYKERGRDDLREQSGFGGGANTDKLRFSSEASHEEAILGMLMIRPDLGTEAAKALKPEDFATALNRKIFELFLPEISEGREWVLSKDGALSARELGALEHCRAARLQLGDISAESLRAHIEALRTLREKNEYDKKIEESPASALGEYLNIIKKKSRNGQEEKDG